VSPRQRACFFLEPELLDGLRRLKERDGVPAAEAVRRAVADLLKARGIVPDFKKAASRRAPTLRKA
jgi:hypothetical protein